MNDYKISAQELVNEKFTRLTLIKSLTSRRWALKCDCGNTLEADKYSVLRGDTKSCGCFYRETRRTSAKTHGMSRHRLYSIWTNIKSRCENEKYHKFHRYGGRGIKILWASFEEFRDDMYESYKDHIFKFGELDTTIERTDNDGNYCKENCRWATRDEQLYNKTRPKKYAGL